MATINGTITIHFDTDKNVSLEEFERFKKEIESSGVFQFTGIVEEAAAETGCGEVISMHSVMVDDSQWSCENDDGYLEDN